VEKLVDGYVLWTWNRVGADLESWEDFHTMHICGGLDLVHWMEGLVRGRECVGWIGGPGGLLMCRWLGVSA